MVNVGTNLFLELEFKNKELLKRERMIHELQRRERELTDRSVSGWDHCPGNTMDHYLNY